MLLELLVENVLIVRSARIEPGLGLTVITGETGAGKSLLLDALDLLMGRRADADLVGPNGDFLTVVAVFVPPPTVCAELAERHGLSSEDGQYIVRRRVSRQGRSQAWVNDVAISVKALREISGLLVELRSQNDQLHLADPRCQLELLDRYGGIDQLANAYALSHQRLRDLESSLTAIQSGAHDSLRELEFARFQLQEIESLQPQRGEWQQLEQRLALLSSAQEWRTLCAEVAHVLGESEEPVVAVVGRFARQLSAAPDERLRQAGEACIQAQDALAEASRLCADGADSLSVDPAELTRIEERIGQFVDLFRKHGGDEDRLFAVWEELSERIEALQGLDQQRESLAQEIAQQRAEWRRLGTELAARRREAAVRLGKRVAKELSQLGMAKALLTFHDIEGSAATAQAFIRQEFHIQTNPGMPAGPLGKVPSGGETSRLSLAFTIALTDAGPAIAEGGGETGVSVLIFDEIDAGVGGRLGGIIASKLSQLAIDKTVIAISHTPQMAAQAQRHYQVIKDQGQQETVVSVEALQGDQRLKEIAEMLGGGHAALNQARVLLGGTPS